MSACELACVRAWARVVLACACMTRSAGISASAQRCAVYVAFCAVVQAKEKAKEERRAHEGKVQSLINRGDGIRSVLGVPRVPQVPWVM